jgi:hypothetical protein
MVSHYDVGQHRVIHRAVNACLAPLCSVDWCAVTTVEGIGSVSTGLHPVQGTCGAQLGRAKRTQKPPGVWRWVGNVPHALGSGNPRSLCPMSPVYGVACLVACGWGWRGGGRGWGCAVGVAGVVVRETLAAHVFWQIACPAPVLPPPPLRFPPRPGPLRACVHVHIRFVRVCVRAGVCVCLFPPANPPSPPDTERIARLHGSQCGFCTPGIVMALYTFLRNHPAPTATELEECMDGNLCR